MISTPASYWRDGNNTLLFRHNSMQGYAIYDATVLFDAGLNNGGETTTTPDGNPDTGDRGTSTSPTGTGSIKLSWVAPVSRADGAALAMSEIAGYTVHYGTSYGNYPYSIAINDGSATSVTVTDLPAGTYYMVMTTRDTEDRYSSYSSMATKQTQKENLAGFRCFSVPEFGLYSLGYRAGTSCHDHWPNGVYC